MAFVYRLPIRLSCIQCVDRLFYHIFPNLYLTFSISDHILLDEFLPSTSVEADLSAESSPQSYHAVQWSSPHRELHSCHAKLLAYA